MTPTSESVAEDLADGTLDAIELLADRVRALIGAEHLTGLDVLCHAKRRLEAEYHAYLTGKGLQS